MVVCVREEEEEEAPVGAAAPGVDLVPPALAKKHEEVTVVFIMVMGFDDMLRGGEPGQALTFLAQLFNKIDALVDEHQVYKVETKGACYVAAGGLMRKDTEGGYVVQGEPGGEEGAVKLMQFAKALQQLDVSALVQGEVVALRLSIGLHTGELVSGVVGQQTPWYCLFGDTMNTCSRMQSTCPPGAVQLSPETRQLLARGGHTQGLRPTGGVLCKGKGTVYTYLWEPDSAESNAGTQQARALSAAPSLGLASDGRALCKGKAAMYPQIPHPQQLQSGWMQVTVHPAARHRHNC